MELLPLATIWRLILLAIYFLSVCSAQDCGNKGIASIITVDQSGKTKFSTIQAAIDSIAENNNQWVKIHINPGTYTEKVRIPIEKPCIFLEGQGSDVTTITYNDHQKTDESATFTSSSDNVIAKDITFKNSFNVAAVLSLQNGNAGGQVVPALAARIYGDKSVFYNCRFIGRQDSLWDVQGRHYFKNCVIEGAVDFIFGNGQSYYEDCVINATSSGFITAQSRRSENDPGGFVFKGGSVVGGVGVRSWLGRAWGPYSRVIFYGTNLGSVVEPRGWSAWHYTRHESNLTYAEVNCIGPGANISKRVHWMKKFSASQLPQFSISSFIDQDGWIAKSPSE